MKLSKRLRQVADWIPENSILADIGSDHGYLPIYLAEQEIIKKAIAGEVNQGPYESAKHNVSDAGLAKQIQVRKGDGLEVLQPGEVNVITICGMGGGTIVHILERGLAKLEGIQCLILQPMADSEHLRKWLHSHQWQIIEEGLVSEEEILYELIKAEPGEEHYPDELWYELGSIDLLKDHPLFLQKVAAAIEKMDRVVTNIQKARGKEAMQKKEFFMQKKKRLEEVLQACNQQLNK